MFPTNERRGRCRRRTFCDVRQFVRDRSSAVTIGDIRLDRRRLRNVHCPIAFTDGHGIDVSDDVG